MIMKLTEEEIKYRELLEDIQTCITTIQKDTSGAKETKILRVYLKHLASHL